MANTKRIRTQVPNEGKFTTEQRADSTCQKRCSFLYPPIPSQREEWSQLLSEVPEVEPTFCRDVNGLMPGMGRRLRAIGKGVVPAVAATAWLNLTEKLTGVINENSNTRTSS